MLDWSLDQKEHPVMILIPGNEVTDREADKDYSKIGKYKVEQQGENVAILHSAISIRWVKVWQQQLKKN